MTDLKQFRRLYPKLRLSYSLYHAYARGNWEAVFSYLLGEKGIKTKAMERGTRIHKQMEAKPIPKEIIKIEKEFFDNKTKRKQKEQRLTVEFDDYTVTGIIDVLTDNLIVDYKSGKLNGYQKQIESYGWLVREALGEDIQNGMLVKVNDDLELERTWMYKLQNIVEWDFIYDSMASEIKENWHLLEEYANSRSL